MMPFSTRQTADPFVTQPSRSLPLKSSFHPASGVSWAPAQESRSTNGRAANLMWFLLDQYARDSVGLHLNHFIRTIPMSKIEEGKKAPDFTLPDQDGKQVSLSDFKGKDVIVWFYPK